MVHIGFTGVAAFKISFAAVGSLSFNVSHIALPLATSEGYIKNCMCICRITLDLCIYSTIHTCFWMFVVYNCACMCVWCPLAWLALSTFRGIRRITATGDRNTKSSSSRYDTPARWQQCRLRGVTSWTCPRPHAPRTPIMFRVRTASDVLIRTRPSAIFRGVRISSLMPPH